MHNIIIVSSDSTRIKDTIQTQKSEVPFLKYKNLVIRNIEFQKLDVFGPTIDDTNKPAKSWLSRTANKVHIKTRDGVLYKHLLFKHGDRIDPYTLADNERILRELPYIEDARIHVENISANGDSADINIIVKDTWSIGLDFTTADLKNLYMDVWDHNILGSGMATNNLIYRNPGQLPYSGLNGYYNIRNIEGSFIDCRIGYSVYGSKGFNVDLTRDFFTQRTKYAGELNFEKMNTYAAINNIEQNTTEYYPLNRTISRFWIGRAFTIRPFGFLTTNISNLIFSSGIYNYYFSKQPPAVTENTMYNYQNRTYYLISYALSSQGYYKSNLIYSFGRTEDIPFGLLIKFTNGIEKNEFYNRVYNSLSISKGNYLGNFGYTYINLSLGGFIRKSEFEQGVLKLNPSFFTNLLVLGSFKFRLFTNVNYIKGYKRFSDEYLNINDLSGIRGLINDSAVGSQKLALNFESVCFTPFYLAGFRFAVFGFADFAYIGKTTKLVFNLPLYSGFGFGIRVRNEKLVFKTFQMRLAFYPFLPKSASSEYFTVSNESKFNTYNFNAKSPEIINFQ